MRKLLLFFIIFTLILGKINAQDSGTTYSVVGDSLRVCLYSTCTNACDDEWIYQYLDQGTPGNCLTLLNDFSVGDVVELTVEWGNCPANTPCQGGGVETFCFVSQEQLVYTCDELLLDRRFDVCNTNTQPLGCDTLLITKYLMFAPEVIDTITTYSCNPAFVGFSFDTTYNGACEFVNVTDTQLEQLDTTIIYETSCNPADTGSVFFVDYDMCIAQVYVTQLLDTIVSQRLIWTDSCTYYPLPPDTLWYQSSLGSGCDSIVIIHYIEHPFPSLDIDQQPSCGQDTEVSFFPLGTTAPYDISWPNGSDDEVQKFSEDIYIDVSVIDSFGCQTDTSIYIDYWEEPIIDLGEDVHVSMGTTVDILPYHTPGSLHWDLPLEIIESEITMSGALMFQAIQSVPVSATVTDSNGCTTTEQVMINVTSDHGVYIPNAFSPNGAGINDTFHPFGGPNVVEVVELHIYNRWGAEIFSRSLFEANDPVLGWDGMFRGQMMNTGVYTYWTKIKFVDGQVRLFKGDVTLMR